MSEVLDPAATPRAAIPLPQQAATPSVLLAMAVQQGADLERLERLMALQERWEANEARKAHADAFARFKAKAITIIKGTTIKDGPLKGKKHADLFDVVSAVTPGLSETGLSVSWKLTKDEKDWIEVTCFLKHVGGHVESVAMGGAPDTGPGRNAIQARGSTKSYLERYTALAILGLAATEADDDGAGGAGSQQGQEQPEAVSALVDKLKAEVQQTATDEAALGFFKKNKAQLANYPHAYQEFYGATVAHRKTLAAKKPTTEGAAS